MELLSVEKTAEKWGISPRSVRNYCARGRIAGAVLTGKIWQIPANAAKPARKERSDRLPKSIAGILQMEMNAKLPGRLYHRLQIDLTYNSNHIEGSRLSKEQTRWIFETQTVGQIAADLPVDDIVETANHFRCVDKVIATFNAVLNECYIKGLHFLLKNGTTASRQPWFAVGDYKKLDNMIGDLPTCPAGKVHAQMAQMLSAYGAAEKSLENIIDLHVRFEQIHPFQDGNGRVGRLILLKECLKYGHTPFIITDELKQFYYAGLSEWRQNRRTRLKETCGAAQDAFKEILRTLGLNKLIKGEEL